MHHGKNTLNDHEGGDQEFGVIDNPYYDDAEDISSSPRRKSQNIVGLNNIQVLTATENVYYKLWECLLYEHTIFVIDAIFSKNMIQKLSYLYQYICNETQDARV